MHLLGHFWNFSRNPNILNQASRNIKRSFGNATSW